jgi:hypothetical protein
MATDEQRLFNLRSRDPLKAFAAGTAYRDEQVAISKTAISRQESKLNDEVRKPWERFQQDNPESLLQTEDDYNQFKATYDDRTPEGWDYLTVYGREKGIDNGFNVTKIAPAWLGSSLDEIREFDPSTLKYNPEALDGAGGIEMQVRVADKKNNRSFTAPITAAGRKVKELFGFGGKEAVEENTVKAFPETILNDIYGAYKEGIGILSKDPGIERLQRPSYTEARDLTFFDTSAGARGQREDYLFNLAGGLESSLAGPDTEPTEGSQEGAEPATSIVPTQKLSEEQINFVLGNRESFLAQRGKSGRTFKNEALPEELRNYVQTKGAPPFGITPEEFNSDKYSQDQRNRLLGRSKNLSDNNIFTAITAAVDPFFGPIDALKAQFGKRSTEDLEKRKEMQNVYKNGGVLNKQVLKDAFEINPNLLSEFQADPIAFADKYKNNLNLLSGKPATTKETTEVTKDSPFKISKEDLSALQEARKNNNLTAYTEILNRIAGNTDISDAQQQKVVDFLGQANNFIRVKNDSQSRAAQNIVLDMWASMSVDQRASYGGALMRFAETGYLSFEGVEQQRKIQKDIADNQPDEDKLSSIGSDLLKLGDDFSAAGYEFNDTDAEKIASRSQQLVGQRDYQAFLSTAGIFLKRAIEQKGQPGLLDRFLAFGQARGPAASGFTLGPNVIAVDAQNKYTDDISAASSFVIISPGGRDERGAEISKNELLEVLGPEGVSLLMGVSAQNANRNPNLRGGG